MSAKKTSTPPKDQTVAHAQYQFILLAAKHVATITKQLEEGEGDPKQHGKVLKIVANDISRAIKGTGASANKKAAAAPMGNPTWCYNNVYLPCVKSGGANCLQKYFNCCG